MRFILLILGLLLGFQVLSQHTPSISKFLLNQQTTSKGLTYYNTGVPIYIPTTEYDTWEFSDIATGNRYYYNDAESRWECYFFFGPEAPVEIVGPVEVTYKSGTWIDTDNFSLFIWDGSQWSELGSGGGGTDINILKSGNLIGTRPGINFIEGTDITLDVVDNPGLSRVDVTINSTGGGGGTFSSFEWGTGLSQITVNDGDLIRVEETTGIDINLSGQDNIFSLDFSELDLVTSIGTQDFILQTAGTEQRINQSDVMEWIVDNLGNNVFIGGNDIDITHNDVANTITVDYSGLAMNIWNWGITGTTIGITNNSSALVDGETGIQTSISGNRVLVSQCFGCNTSQKVTPESGDFLLLQDATDFQYKYFTIGDLPGGGIQTLSNGLTLVGSDGQLGGTLTASTQLDFDSNPLNFTNVELFQVLSPSENGYIYFDPTFIELTVEEIDGPETRAGLVAGGGSTSFNFQAYAEIYTGYGPSGSWNRRLKITEDSISFFTDHGGINVQLTAYDERTVIRTDTLEFTGTTLIGFDAAGGPGLWTDATGHIHPTTTTNPVGIGTSGMIGNTTLYIRSVTGNSASHDIIRMQAQDGLDVVTFDAQGKMIFTGDATRAIDIGNDADIRFTGGTGSQIQWGSGGPYLDQSSQGILIRGSSSTSRVATFRANSTDKMFVDGTNGLEVDEITTMTLLGTLTISGWRGGSGTAGGDVIVRGGHGNSSNLGMGGDLLLAGGQGNSGANVDTSGIVRIGAYDDAGGSFRTLATVTNEWIKLGRTGIGVEPESSKAFHVDGLIRFENIGVDNSVTQFLGVQVDGDVVLTDGSGLPGGGTNLGNSDLTQTSGTRIFDVANQGSGILEFKNFNRFMITNSGPSGIIDIGGTPDANQTLFLRAGSSSSAQLEAGTDYISVLGGSDLILFTLAGITRGRIRSVGWEPPQYGTPPAGPIEGNFIYNTTLDDMQLYNGSDWISLGHPPQFTTAGRPASPPSGYTIYNTTTNKVQTYDGSTWNDHW